MFTEYFNGKSYQIYEDEKWVIFWVLINWVYEKQFNKEFLHLFDSWDLYIWWKLNTKLASFLTNFEDYEKN